MGMVNRGGLALILADFYQKLFKSSFRNSPWIKDISINSSAIAWTSELSAVKIPSGLERFDSKMKLSDGSCVGVAYYFAPSWGFIVSTFHENREGARTWGYQSNNQLMTDLIKALATKKTVARQFSVVVDTCFPVTEEAGGWGLGQVVIGGSFYLIGKKGAAALAMKFFESSVLKKQKVRTLPSSDK
jgi:hypothetical protein